MSEAKGIPEITIDDAIDSLRSMLEPIHATAMRRRDQILDARLHPDDEREAMIQLSRDLELSRRPVVKQIERLLAVKPIGPLYIPFGENTAATKSWTDS